jgi:uncharacterized protein YdhG (YjbR/CyaY superfamily)
MSQTEKKTKKSAGFTADEKAAMKERAKELKAAASKEEAEAAVLEKIAEMSEPDRSMATKIHQIVKATAPELAPKTWYGMPAYTRDGKVVCFYQAAEKFDARYATLGFNDSANLDDGDLFPVVFALKKLTAAEEKRIAELVKKAVS